MKSLALLKRTGGIRYGISSSLTSDEEKKIAFVKGAFLGGGSCIVPNEGAKTGYHLEIVFFDKQTACDFCDLLEEFELLVRLVERKETFVVYIKSKVSRHSHSCIIHYQKIRRCLISFAINNNVRILTIQRHSLNFTID